MLTDWVHALRRWAARSNRRSVRGVHSRWQFRRVLVRERARSDRSGDRFSLIVFKARDLATADTMWPRLTRILRQRLRLTDEMGWLDGQLLGAVLPATPPRGAWKLADDICRQFEPHIVPLCSVYSYPSETDQLDRSIPESRRAGEIESPPLPAEARPIHALELLFAQGVPLWKRLIDVVGATLGLIALAPLLIFVAAVIKATSRGPILFRQQRTGLGGRVFWMYKFRSMVADAEGLKGELLARNEQDGPAFKIENDPRITRIGRLIRSTSIDELPQLWNVLRGEMTLVGPRPLPCSESDGCSVWQRRRLDVTPGLTCIWQVRGRSRVTFNEWVRMDLEYVQRRSLWQDVKILLATLPAVLLRRGAR